MSVISCGIDFGTSNLAIAVSGLNIQPELIKLKNNKFTEPSIIFYREGCSMPLFGEEAEQAYMDGEQGRFMRSLKRVLGSDLMSSGTLINGKLYQFSDILSLFIKSLKGQAEKHCGQSLENVVMGRPVHFRDNDEKGDKRAEAELEMIARKTGFKNVSFQYEPIAAAFAHEENLEKETLACVVDIGGGTSDFSVIRLGNKLREKTERKDDILANSGVRIGGNDFDKDLNIECFMPELGYKTTYGLQNLPVPSSQYFDLAEWSKVNSVYSYKNQKIVSEVLSNAHQPELYARLLDLIRKENGHRLLNDVEQTKIILTEQETEYRKLPYIKGAPKICIKKDDFEKSITGDVEKISNAMAECLTLAGVKKENIGLVILTGGSTEIPFVQKTMYRHFPHAVFSTENKLASVGLGLAFDGRRKFA